MPKFIDMTSAPWAKANFMTPPEDNARSPKVPNGSTGSQSPSSVTIHAEAIKFSGADTDYNPLYDRATQVENRTAAVAERYFQK